MHSDLTELIKEVKESLNSKTYSERNPQLGRMIKCKFCNMRHRSRMYCRQAIEYIKENKIG